MLLSSDDLSAWRQLRPMNAACRKCASRRMETGTPPIMVSVPAKRSTNRRCGRDQTRFQKRKERPNEFQAHNCCCSGIGSKSRCFLRFRRGCNAPGEEARRNQEDEDASSAHGSRADSIAAPGSGRPGKPDRRLEDRHGRKGCTVEEGPASRRGSSGRRREGTGSRRSREPGRSATTQPRVTRCRAPSRT